MGSCQHYGPFLGTLNIRCRTILGTQRGTLILTTTHILGKIFSPSIFSPVCIVLTPSPVGFESKDGCVLLLMDKILHDLKDSKLWELWYIPYYGQCRILTINSRDSLDVTRNTITR